MDAQQRGCLGNKDKMAPGTGRSKCLTISMCLMTCSTCSMSASKSGTRETFLVLLHLIWTDYSLKEVQSGHRRVSGEICRNGRGQSGDTVTKDGIYEASSPSTALKMVLIHLHLEAILNYHADDLTESLSLFSGHFHENSPQLSYTFLQVEQGNLRDHRRLRQARSLSSRPDRST